MLDELSQKEMEKAREIGELAELAFYYMLEENYEGVTPDCWLSSTREKYFPSVATPTNDKLGTFLQ